ncbi:MAG: LacI family DNA-binding transcriptional regulator [Casimicrobiaceae bacterium]
MSSIPFAPRESSAVADVASSLRPSTLLDVARAAGVSTATVSRAWNRPDTVREPLRQRIHAAVEQLHYIPNNAARALVSQRSRVLGAIVPTIDNAIFARGVAAIQARVEASGYGLLLAACDYDLDRELAQARAMVARGVEALVLVGTRHRPALRELLHQHRIPYVCQGAFAPEEDPHCVGFDNRRAGMLVARYLLSLGHRRIAMIAGPRRDNDRAQSRAVGVHSVLADAGLVPPSPIAPAGEPPSIHSGDDSWLVESAYDFDAARAVARLLLTASMRPTALICGNDILALGALRECQSLELAVPAQVSITGFDDLALARQATPALTTIRVATSVMGEAAADFVLAQLAGQPASATEIPFKLVIRGSTGPALKN